MASATPNRRAILTATLASAWLCGGLSCISLLAIPALAESTSTRTLVRQFTKLHRLGRLTQPPGAALTALLWLFAAYQSRSSTIQGRGKALTAAAASSLGILGFTFAVLEPTSHALMDSMHYHDIERNDGQEESALLRKWGVLNGVRAAMAGTAAGLGAWVLMG